MTDVFGWVKIDEVREHFESVGCGTIYKTAGENRVSLYTTPQQRTWVGLTNEERLKLYRQFEDCLESDGWEYEKAIEAKLKDKNNA